MFKKIALAAATAAAFTGLVAPAQASPLTNSHLDTPGCVSRSEFRRVEPGMTPARVARIFDTRGRLALVQNKDGFSWRIARSYDTCPGLVRDGKYAVVVYFQTRPDIDNNDVFREFMKVYFPA